MNELIDKVQKVECSVKVKGIFFRSRMLFKYQKYFDFQVQRVKHIRKVQWNVDHKNQGTHVINLYLDLQFLLHLDINLHVKRPTVVLYFIDNKYIKRCYAAIYLLTKIKKFQFNIFSTYININSVFISNLPVIANTVSQHMRII